MLHPGMLTSRRGILNPNADTGCFVIRVLCLYDIINEERLKTQQQLIQSVHVDIRDLQKAATYGQYLTSSILQIDRNIKIMSGQEFQLCNTNMELLGMAYLLCNRLKYFSTV